MEPVSSETMITRESDSSLMPMAARWRVPMVLLMSWRRVRGKMQAALRMRSSLMITPPSWIALFGKKMVSSISGEASQSTMIPDSTISCKCVACSMAISAPMRASLSRSTAWMMTSMFSRCSRSEPKKVRLPKPASRRRSSGWKITSTATAEKPKREVSSAERTVSLSAAQSSVAPIRPRRATTIGQPRVPRKNLSV